MTRDFVETALKSMEPDARREHLSRIMLRVSARRLWWESEAKTRHLQETDAAASALFRKAKQEVEQWAGDRKAPLAEQQATPDASTTGLAGSDVGAETRPKVAASSEPKGSTDANSLESWAELEVRFLSEERVQLAIRGQSRETLNYEEFGFSDRRNGKPNQPWRTFLKLAQSLGILTIEGALRNDRNRIEKDVQSIRRVLRRRFPRCASQDPLPWEGDGYRAKFMIRTTLAFAS